MIDYSNEDRSRVVQMMGPQSKTILAVELDTDVNLEAVKNEMGYGTTTTEDGAPAVVRYEVEFPD